jgi:hypothetical protein
VKFGRDAGNRAAAILQGGGEAPDEARHSLDRFFQATAGSDRVLAVTACHRQFIQQ